MRFKANPTLTKVQVDEQACRDLYKLPALRHPLLRAAKACAAQARRDAPKKEGNYRNSIFASAWNIAYPEAIYGATDYKTWWIEFGSKNRMPAHHNLVNAARKQHLRVSHVLVVSR